MMSSSMVNATKFFSYDSKNVVADQAAIDKDFRDMIALMELKTPEAFEEAKMVYDHGAHSKTFAFLTLVGVDENDGPFFGGNTIPYGTTITGHTKSGHKVVGSLLEDLHYGKNKKKTHLLFQYPVYDDLENHADCQMTIAPTRSLKRKMTAGCLAESGSITVDVLGLGGAFEMKYTYNTTNDNRSARSIYGLSRDAEDTMLSCSHGCPHPYYFKFYNYYNRPDFADNFIHSAFNEKKTNLAKGNQNFNLTRFSGRAEAIELGILDLTIRPFVIRGMELSLAKCNKGCGENGDECDMNKQVNGWDQAVAYYTGSLEKGRGEHGGRDGKYKSDPSWGEGFLLYNYADTMCRRYGTCGFDGRGNSGTSLVNYQIFKLFEEGQKDILAGRCDDAKAAKRKIVQIMSVPTIQSLLRTAHYLNKEGTDPERRVVSKGAALAAAVVPLVHRCNATDAKVIYENMKIEKALHFEKGKSALKTTKYKQVKEALERNYDCLGITCKDVGGLINDPEETDLERKYMPGAIPCARTDVTKKDEPDFDLKEYASQLQYGTDNDGGAIIRTIAIVTIITSMLVFCVSVISFYFMRANVFCCRRDDKEYEGREDAMVSVEVSGMVEVDDYDDAVVNVTIN